MVSKLTPVKIRDIWKNEARDFTPWLVEHIERLNEDIGLNIQDPRSEEKLVNFSVDIVGEDSLGKVIIENQFSKSDHDHLGKLITYLSNIENTKKAIWIVEETKPEHKNAIEWLNENAGTCDFYLIRIRVYTIDKSTPAVQFDLISGPDEHTKEVGKVIREDHVRYKHRFKFWSIFLDKVNKETAIFQNISPTKSYWVSATSGVRGISYGLSLLKSTAFAYLYIDKYVENRQKINKEIFNELYKNKEEIENNFGSELEWVPSKENEFRCMIKKTTNIGGWNDVEKYEEIQNNLIEFSIGFKKAFGNRIEKFK